MSIKVILNPRADLGRGVTHLGTIQEAAESLGEIDLVLTTHPGHAEELAMAAVNNGYDIVVAAGGDGTVHEVVNGIIAAETNRDVKLGVVPTGTGNDFAHAMGIVGDVPSAVRTLFEGRERRVDLALMVDDKGRQRYFQNNLGVGFDANVVIRTAEITRVHGFLKYLLAVLTTLARDYHPINLQIRFDEEVVSQEVLFIILGIGPRHGGGFMLTPDASHEDDLIDSCTVSMLGRFRALSLLNSAVKGTHIRVPYVTMRNNKLIQIESREPMPIHIDGEIYAQVADNVRKLTVTSLPSSLVVIV